MRLLSRSFISGVGFGEALGIATGGMLSGEKIREGFSTNAFTILHGE